jgi:PTS system ascorbate-specific IIB component
MGVGTSMLLKLQIDKAVKALGLDAKVELADISTARGLALEADLIVTSNELADRIGSVKAPIVKVVNFMDLDELTNNIRSALEEQ